MIKVTDTENWSREEEVLIYTIKPDHVRLVLWNWLEEVTGLGGGSLAYMANVVEFEIGQNANRNVDNRDGTHQVIGNWGKGYSCSILAKNSLLHAAHEKSS